MSNFFKRFFDFNNLANQNDDRSLFEEPSADHVFPRHRDDDGYNSLRESVQSTLFRRPIGNRVHQQINDIIRPHTINAYESNSNSTNKSISFQGQEKTTNLKTGDPFYSKEFEKELIFISLTNEGLAIGFSSEENAMYWCSLDKI